jgi:hypothetical protein
MKCVYLLLFPNKTFHSKSFSNFIILFLPLLTHLKILSKLCHTFNIFVVFQSPFLTFLKSLRRFRNVLTNQTFEKLLKLEIVNRRLVLSPFVWFRHINSFLSFICHSMNDSRAQRGDECEQWKCYEIPFISICFSFSTCLVWPKCLLNFGSFKYTLNNSFDHGHWLWTLVMDTEEAPEGLGYLAMVFNWDWLFRVS